MGARSRWLADGVTAVAAGTAAWKLMAGKAGMALHSGLAVSATTGKRQRIVTVGQE